MEIPSHALHLVKIHFNRYLGHHLNRCFIAWIISRYEIQWEILGPLAMEII